MSILIVGLAVAFVRITGMTPAYDAYGWLVWGHQALRGSLNLNSAPSWKPLPFLFTLPYSLLGKQTAYWLWVYTAVTAAFAAPVFGGRCAYWLVRAPGARRWPALVAAVAAGAGVLGILGYWHFILIAYADPMMVALTLAAIDFHLGGRRRAAWAMVVLVALGRPEMWVVGRLYARVDVAHGPGHAPLPARRGSSSSRCCGSGVSRLASPFWLVSSHIDKLSTAGFHVHGSRVQRRAGRLLQPLRASRSRSPPLCALALALVRRDRRALWLFAAAAAVAAHRHRARRPRRVARCRATCSRRPLSR